MKKIFSNLQRESIVASCALVDFCVIRPFSARLLCQFNLKETKVSEDLLSMTVPNGEYLYGLVLPAQFVQGGLGVVQLASELQDVGL